MDQNAAVSPDPPPQYFTNTYYGFGSDMLILIALFFAAVVAHFLSIAYNNRQHPVYTNEQEKLAGMDASSTIMEARRRLEEQERTNDPAARRPRNPVIVRALCPVCLQADLIFPVETNCGHKFCTRCFLQYWRADRRFPGACSCPMCRRSINLVIPDRRNVKCTEYAYLLAQVADFNNKMTKEPRTFWSQVQDAPLLLGYLFDELFSTNGLLCAQRLRVIFVIGITIIYFVLPVDLLPEMMFGGFGILDDLFMAFGLFLSLSFMYRDFLINRYLSLVQNNIDRSGDIPLAGGNRRDQ